VADWRGKIVVVNYWATWCVPCQRELPDLSRFARDNRSKGVVVLTLTNEDPVLVQRWGGQALRETVVGLFADDTPRSGLAGVALQWRPVTLVLDQRSAVRQVLMGRLTYATLEKAVRATS